SLDDIQTGRRVTLPDDRVAWKEVRAGHALGRSGPHVPEVARKDHEPEPVEADLDPPGPGGKLEEIDGAPQEPGDEPRDPQAEYLGDGAPGSDRAELPERFEREGPARLAAQRGDDVVRAPAALPLRELAGRRAGKPVHGVHDGRAVADRPDPRFPV